MKVQIAVAALAVLLAVGSACRYDDCPDGYVKYTWGNQACPTCVFYPSYLQCPGLKDPICCGGDNDKVCPAIACTTSTSYAIAGPHGCARAHSTIVATAISKSAYVSVVNETAAKLGAYCTAGYPSPEDWDQAIKVTSEAAASAFAKAVAKATADFRIFVCACGNCRYRYANCNTAYSAVTAKVQAVARAQAYAFASAIAEVKDKCYPNEDYATLVAYAQGQAEAFASSTELAILEVMKKAVSTGPATCQKISGEETEKAVARAVACAFVSVLASARDNITPNVARSCSSTLALAGKDAMGADWTAQCNLRVKCKNP